MDLETACHDLREPGVIDEKIIFAAIIEQGPKGEEGKLFQEQGISYKEITELRLDFLNVLKIDHLWMMTGLTRLQLCNNVIEKIENLEVLVHLKELDLSFNHIEKIENLDTLLELEVLTLFQNKIEVIENMSHLKKITVFSIGNNKISSMNNIMYLRTLESLRSLNLAGNPLCGEEKFLKYLVAYLPQLVYYEYRMITKTEKEEARAFYMKDLIRLERDEAERKEIENALLKEEKEEILNAEAFVEYLGGNHLFLSLFEKDAEWKVLEQMGETALDAYNEYKQNFTELTREIHRFGIEQLELRKQEIAQFKKQTGAAKEKVFKESREIIEDFLEQRTYLFAQIGELNTEEEEDDEGESDSQVRVQEISDEFKQLCSFTWRNLMKREVHLSEAMEEVNANFERTMTELVNQFVEGIQALFVQIRLHQSTFNENLSEGAAKFLTNYTVLKGTDRSPRTFKNVSPELLELLNDKELLTSSLTTSHDNHLLIIDQREDKLLTGVKSWLANLLENMTSSEINRNRRTVTEINHFLDFEKSKFHELLSTHVGLLIMPKEIQEALQM